MTHVSAGAGMLSMSLAVVLLAIAAADGAAAPFAPLAEAAEPPAADLVLVSGTLKSFTAAYSSRILHAIFTRWLHDTHAMVSHHRAPFPEWQIILERRSSVIQGGLEAEETRMDKPLLIQWNLLPVVASKQVERAFDTEEGQCFHSLALNR